MDRQSNQLHELTLAVHPSENDYRFIVRVIDFTLNAHEQLVFTKGLGADDEPEPWLKSLSGGIELWIDFAQVDEKRVRRACGRSEQVIIYTYQELKATVWLKQYREKLAYHKIPTVCYMQAEGAVALVSRNMQKTPAIMA